VRLEELAVRVIEAAEAEGVDFMAVGAIAAGAYGVPRSTRDVEYIERWCSQHGTLERLKTALDGIPPLD
jgi:hypothetical protein